MVELTFMPSGKTIVVKKGMILMDAIINAQLPIGQSCGSVAVCAKCGVRIIKGQENLSPMSSAEKKLLMRDHLAQEIRLSCLVRVHGPVTIQADYW